MTTNVHNRELPSRIFDDVTQTNHLEAINTILLAAHNPSRRSKLLRVLHNGQPLWLSKNRTTFKTKAAARNAVENWLFDWLVALVPSPNGQRRYYGHNYQECYNILEARIGPTLTESERAARSSSFGVLLTYIKKTVTQLFERGVLRLEEVSLEVPTED